MKVAVGYDDERATNFARLAGAAYCSLEALEAWDCGEKCIAGVQRPVRVCPGESTQAYVAMWEGQGLVAFQGTHTMMSMVQDLRFNKAMTPWTPCANCSVHTGFLTEWLSLSTCVEDALAIVGSPRGSEIRVVGHSLGGAVAVLGMVSLAVAGWEVSEAYTFGMPRTGDEAFSKVFAHIFELGTFFRVTHHMDPVPHVPPEEFGFFHVAPEVFFDNNFTSHVVCMHPENERCAGQYSDLPLDIMYVADHLVYMGVQTGSAGCEEPHVPSNEPAADIVFGEPAGDIVV